MDTISVISILLDTISITLDTIILYTLQECVQALLSDEQLRDIPDSEGHTALMWAARNSNYVAMQLLLESQVTDVHTCEKNGTTGQHHYQYVPSKVVIGLNLVCFSKCRTLLFFYSSSCCCSVWVCKLCQVVTAGM